MVKDVLRKFGGILFVFWVLDWIIIGYVKEMVKLINLDMFS